MANQRTSGCIRHNGGFCHCQESAHITDIKSIDFFFFQIRSELNDTRREGEHPPDPTETTHWFIYSMILSFKCGRNGYKCLQFRPNCIDYSRTDLFNNGGLIARFSSPSSIYCFFLFYFYLYFFFLHFIQVYSIFNCFVFRAFHSLARLRIIELTASISPFIDD